jgi:hypothetical protein
MFLINAPIEPIENRYSKQWDEWIRSYLNKILSGDKNGITYITVYGSKLDSNTIDNHHFLNPLNTGIWKTSQMCEIIKIIKHHHYEGETEFGVFFHDLWNPGIEQLKYIESMLEISIKIFGILHAGTWDEWDLTYQKCVQNWSKNFETGWLLISNTIFVATEFHKNLILKFVRTQLDDKDYISINKKIKVTSLPFYDSISLVNTKLEHKKNWVAFPHRLSKEKSKSSLDFLNKELKNRGYELKITQNLTKTKDEFYTLLNQCKYSISLAKQETFGISMIESLFAGCIPIVPDALSYPEIFLDLFRYPANTDYSTQYTLKLLDTFQKMDNNYLSELINVNREQVETKSAAAIPNMFHHIISSMTRLN